jgi:uncharacterized membrane protein YfcA
MTLILLPIIGCVVGLCSSFFGIGGGVILVPFMIFMFPQMQYPQILATSFGVIFLNSLINTYNYKKSGIDLKFKNHIVIIIGILIGVLFGIQIIEHIGVNTGRKIFSIYLFLVIIKILFYKTEQLLSAEKKVNHFISILCGTATGFIASITGIGGGTLLIPIFVSIFKTPLKIVAPKANYLMIFISLFGITRLVFSKNQAYNFTNYSEVFQFGNIHLDFIFLIFLGSFLTSKLGVKINNKVTDHQKKQSLVALLLIILLLLIYKAFT